MAWRIRRQPATTACPTVSTAGNSRPRTTPRRRAASVRLWIRLAASHYRGQEGPCVRNSPFALHRSATAALRRLARLAFSLDNAWTRAGAPLAASAYVAPPGNATVDDARLLPAEMPHPTIPAGIFDEVRLGATTFWQRGDTSGEGGLYVTGQVLFDPVVPAVRQMLPRYPAAAAAASRREPLADGGRASSSADLTWTVPLPSVFFLEASFGGTVHDARAGGRADRGRVPRALPREPRPRHGTSARTGA